MSRTSCRRAVSALALNAHKPPIWTHCKIVYLGSHSPLRIPHRYLGCNQGQSQLCTIANVGSRPMMILLLVLCLAHGPSRLADRWNMRVFLRDGGLYFTIDTLAHACR